LKYFTDKGKIRDDFYDLLQTGSVSDALRVVYLAKRGLLTKEESKKALRIVIIGRNKDVSHS